MAEISGESLETRLGEFFSSKGFFSDGPLLGEVRSYRSLTPYDIRIGFGPEDKNDSGTCHIIPFTLDHEWPADVRLGREYYGKDIFSSYFVMALHALPEKYAFVLRTSFQDPTKTLDKDKRVACSYRLGLEREADVELVAPAVTAMFDYWIKGIHHHLDFLKATEKFRR